MTEEILVNLNHPKIAEAIQLVRGLTNARPEVTVMRDGTLFVSDDETTLHLANASAEYATIQFTHQGRDMLLREEVSEVIRNYNGPFNLAGLLAFLEPLSGAYGDTLYREIRREGLGHEKSRIWALFAAPALEALRRSAPIYAENSASQGINPDQYQFPLLFVASFQAALIGATSLVSSPALEDAIETSYADYISSYVQAILQTLAPVQSLHASAEKAAERLTEE